MRKKDELKSPYIYILIGGALIIFLKLVVLDSRTPFQDTIYDGLNNGQRSGTAEESLADVLRQEREERDRYDLFDDIDRDFLDVDVPVPGQEDALIRPVPAAVNPRRDEVISEDVEAPFDPVEGIEEEKQEEQGEALPEKQGYVPLAPANGDVRIAVIIDDVGVARKHSLDAIHKLPAAVTLAILPYAAKIDELAQEALKEGHELMAHAPMEAMDHQQDLGPIALRADMDEAAFKAAFVEILESFKGASGVNNHMGSKLTQDPQKMAWVMEVLQDRDFYFVDSKTIHTSIAADVAQRFGIPYAERHVFIDHEDSIDYVRGRLKILEANARSRGYAVAIGHPKGPTIKALREWIPTLREKGIRLVPASALIYRPSHDVAAAQPDVGGAVFDALKAESDRLTMELLDIELPVDSSMNWKDLGSFPEHPAPRGQ